MPVREYGRFMTDAKPKYDRLITAIEYHIRTNLEHALDTIERLPKEVVEEYKRDLSIRHSDVYWTISENGSTEDLEFDIEDLEEFENLKEMCRNLR